MYIASGGALALGGAAARALLLAGCAAMAAVTLVARVWLAAWPAQYLQYREQQMLLQRAVWMLYLLLLVCCCTTADWAGILERKAGPRPRGAAAEQQALASVLVALGGVPALHCMLFSFRLRIAAPLQLATCSALYTAMQPLACTAKLDPLFAAAARRLCWRLQGLQQLLLTMSAAAAPAAARSVDGGVCEEGAVELLIAFALALSCFASLYVLQADERRLKRQYLGCHGGATATSHAHAATGLPPLSRHMLWGAAAALASLAVAETSAAQRHQSE
ncbi:hypothetical protein MNEG_1359 [Monoraphidium neglectum]|uniref:Uncharacterized protein n=1 Tax=Monoraphidium neglectum TaxID=145388 RepID=A0A0D2LJK8_9CHLO|nr:hypothetical protein MNEG_1359 [Monoraphidium neglectum]KIZ06589.1 hypothetical protein MNEG_1359 [Monoraphidium neglectum]|eukprot:XP_013905608.1 hypothetical protein MNEG_1359 [Monoraphidium neglectum]